MFLNICRGIPGRAATLALLLAALPGTGCSDEPNRQISRIYELQAEPTEANLRKVREQLSNPDGDVRATALHVLVNHPVNDGASLALAALEDEHPFVRMTAAILLGDLEAREAVPALGRRLVEDGDWHVRQRAAEALARIGGDEAAALIRAGFSDPLMEVRRASIMGLSRLAPGDSLEGLVLLLREDPEWEVRVQAARALAVLGDPSAIPALQGSVEEDANEFVRAAAAHAVKVLADGP